MRESEIQQMNIQWICDPLIAAVDAKNRRAREIGDSGIVLIIIIFIEEINFTDN